MRARKITSYKVSFSFIELVNNEVVITPSEPEDIMGDNLTDADCLELLQQRYKGKSIVVTKVTKQTKMYKMSLETFMKYADVSDVKEPSKSEDGGLTENGEQ